MKRPTKLLPYLFAALCSIASADSVNIEPSKVYVRPSEISVENNEIRVLVNENWLTTNAVFSDANGLYIVDSKGGWTCGRCNYYNTGNLWVCDNCQAQR